MLTLDATKEKVKEGYTLKVGPVSELVVSVKEATALRHKQMEASDFLERSVKQTERLGFRQTGEKEITVVDKELEKTLPLEFSYNIDEVKTRVWGDQGKTFVDKYTPMLRDLYAEYSKAITAAQCPPCQQRSKLTGFLTKVAQTDMSEEAYAELGVLVSEGYVERVKSKAYRVAVPAPVQTPAKPQLTSTLTADVALRSSMEAAAAEAVAKAGTISDTLPTTTKTSRPSCIMCFRKHIAQAIVLLEEYISNSELYWDRRWLAMGHMQEAAVETFEDYPELGVEVYHIRKQMESHPEFIPQLLPLINKTRFL